MASSLQLKQVRHLLAQFRSTGRLHDPPGATEERMRRGIGLQRAAARPKSAVTALTCTGLTGLVSTICHADRAAIPLTNVLQEPQLRRRCWLPCSCHTGSSRPLCLGVGCCPEGQQHQAQPAGSTSRRQQVMCCRSICAMCAFITCARAAAAPACPADSTGAVLMKCNAAGAHTQ